jgi:hypothetical protein
MVKTIVKLTRGTRETTYEGLDLPYIPEGAVLHVPHGENCRVIVNNIDICPADGPEQTLVVR